MERFYNIEEALKKPAEVMDLWLDSKECEKDFPDTISQLKNLKKLTLLPESSTFRFPKVFETLPVEELYIAHIGIPDISGMKSVKKLQFRIISPEKFIDLCNMIGNFPLLDSLRIWMNGKKLEIPKEIKKLTQLKKLEFSNADINDLPDELFELETLEHLDLSIIKSLTALPGKIGNLTCLKELHLDRIQCLDQLPDEIGNLQNLEVLRLAELFNSDFYKQLREKGGIYEEPERKEITAPECLSRLKNLEELYINSCPVTDLRSIETLTKLKKLDISFTGIHDISVLSNLKEIRDLDIGFNDQIKNLKPVMDLPKLINLDISNTAGDNVKDGKILLSHPTLESLETGSESLRKMWEKRNDPPVDINEVQESTGLPRAVIDYLAGDDEKSWEEEEFGEFLLYGSGELEQKEIMSKPESKDDPNIEKRGAYPVKATAIGRFIEYEDIAVYWYPEFGAFGRYDDEHGVLEVYSKRKDEKELADWNDLIKDMEYYISHFDEWNGIPESQMVHEHFKLWEILKFKKY